MANPDNHRRHTSIAQLRAVAKSEGAKQLKRDTRPQANRDLMSYKAQPSGANKQSEARAVASKTSLLTLEPDQRVDLPNATKADDVTSTSLNAKSFAEFFADQDTDLPEDRLIAAAEFFKMENNTETFTRKDIMEVIFQTYPDTYSREENLIAFAMLIKENRVKRLESGQFKVISENGNEATRDD